MRYRLVGHADLPGCLDLLDHNGRCMLSPRVRAQLPGLWADWLAQDRRFPKPFVLWEDLRAPHRPVIAAIAAGLFVRDAVYDELLRTPRPYLADRLYGMVLDGHAPILDQRDIARANAGEGLSVVMPYHLQREHDPTHPDSLRLMPLGPAGWYFCYSGFNVRRILGEVYGQPASEHMKAGGFRIAHAFDAAPDMPPDSEPRQAVLDRTHACGPALDVMSLWIMPPTPPLLGLPRSQQAVATLALQGDTDRAIAARLAISADAVKQAWRGILRAVSRHLPELCADTTGTTASGMAPVRGAEHRRVVVEYLRQHMEELRPWKSPRSSPIVSFRGAHAE